MCRNRSTGHRAMQSALAYARLILMRRMKGALDDADTKPSVAGTIMPLSLDDRQGAFKALVEKGLKAGANDCQRPRRLK